MSYINLHFKSRSKLLFLGHKLMWLNRLWLYFSWFNLHSPIPPNEVKTRPIFSLNSSLKMLASPLHIGNRGTQCVCTEKKKKTKPRSMRAKFQVPLFPSQDQYSPEFHHICGSPLAKIPTTISVSQLLLMGWDIDTEERKWGMGSSTVLKHLSKLASHWLSPTPSFL